MGKKNDDGTYLVFSASDLSAFGRYLIAGVLAVLAAFGFEARNRFVDVGRSEFEVLAQGQEDLRQMVVVTQSRSFQCENRIGSLEGDISRLWKAIRESSGGRYTRASFDGGE